jgi:hypothetical protein
MKSFIATLVTLLAVSAFAADAPKATTPAPAATPTPAVTAPAKKEEVKPVKSEKKVEAKTPAAK